MAKLEENPFFKEHPEILSKIQAGLNGRESRVTALHDRLKMLSEQMNLLKGQVDLHQKINADQPISAELEIQITNIGKAQLKVMDEYAREFTVEQNLIEPDQGDIEVIVEGQKVFVDSNLVDGYIKGEPEAISAVNDMSNEENPLDQLEAKAIAQLAAQDILSQEEQVMFRDTGETSVTRSGVSQEIPNLPQTPTTQQASTSQANQTTVDLIRSAITKRGTLGAVSEGVSALKGKLAGNVQRGK